MNRFDRLRHRVRKGLALVAGALLAAGTAIAAAPAPRLTIVDGEALVIDGDRALVAAEGQPLGDEALLRTGGRSTLVRIEWADGSVADLGPDTQAMVQPSGFGQRDGRPPALYLLRGWAKLGGPAGAMSPGLLTPRVDLQPFKGSVVVMAIGGETWLFVESGSAPLIERDLKPASNVSLRNGEVYARDGAAKGTVAPRPTPAQMQRVPRGFRDALPLRLATIKDRSVTPKPAAAPGYADLREWLTAERPLRRNFTRRFVQRTREPAFRSGLADNLASHPEWEPVLFPERFVKPAPASAPR